MEELLLPQEKVRRYHEDGFVRIKDVLSPADVDKYEPEVSRIVQEFSKKYPRMEERSSCAKQFIQYINLWRKSELVKELVFSKKIARMAAELMKVQGVRLYHDQALYKEPGGGETLWHQDRGYWPLSSDNAITAWIALNDIPVEMGPLAFARGSHQIGYKSTHVITPEGQKEIIDLLKSRGRRAEHAPFETGEVSFHHPWTLHTARPNKTDQMRRVFTIIYIEEGMRLAEPTPTQIGDSKYFAPGVEVGEPIATKLNPLLWTASDPK